MGQTDFDLITNYPLKKNPPLSRIEQRFSQRKKCFLGEYCPDTKNSTVTGGKNCFQGAGLQKEGQSITGAFGIPPKILGFSVTYLQKGAACDVSTSF